MICSGYEEASGNVLGRLEDELRFLAAGRLMMTWCRWYGGSFWRGQRHFADVHLSGYEGRDKQ